MGRRLLLVAIVVVAWGEPVLAQDGAFGPRRPEDEVSVPRAPVAADGGPRRIRRVVLDPRQVFDRRPGDPVRNLPELIAALANGLHVRTREHVLRREILLAEGDVYRVDRVRETARNLRRLDYLAEARIQPVPVGPDEVDVIVRTRDRFTLRLGAGLSVVGGETRGNAVLGEGNLFGLGLDVLFRTVRLSDRTIVSGSFTEPRLLGSRTRFGVDASLARARRDRPRDNYRVGASLSRPFYALDVDWSWALRAAHQRDDLPYYEDGDEVANLPEDRSNLTAGVTRAFGSPWLRPRLGAEVSYERHHFQEPFGDDTTYPRRPADFDATTGTLRAGLDVFLRHLTRTQVDAIDYVEDIPIGLTTTVEAGASYWDLDQEGWRTPLAADLTVSLDPWPRDQLLVLQARGAVRLRDDTVEAHRLSTFAHYYLFALPAQTLAVNLAFDAVEDENAVRPQLTLGEDNGLRGYEARRFTGRRMLRLNVEDRIFTPLEIAHVHLGLVTFADAGFVWDRYDDVEVDEPDDLLWSAGFGLRVGSARFFGSAVGRLDVAFPLNDPEGFDVSVSLSAGQVFSAFGISDELDVRF